MEITIALRPPNSISIFIYHVSVRPNPAPEITWPKSIVCFRLYFFAIVRVRDHICIYG